MSVFENNGLNNSYARITIGSHDILKERHQNELIALRFKF